MSAFLSFLNLTARNRNPPCREALPVFYLKSFYNYLLSSPIAKLFDVTTRYGILFTFLPSLLHFAIYGSNKISYTKNTMSVTGTLLHGIACSAPVFGKHSAGICTHKLHWSNIYCRMIKALPYSYNFYLPLYTHLKLTQENCQ